MKSYSIEDAVTSIIDIGKRMGLKNYTPGYSGNVSVRTDSGVLMTVSGSSNGYLTENDLVLIDYNGKNINSDKKATSEKFLHLKFYELRPDINAVIHVHPPALTAFASAGQDLMSPVMPENIFYFGGIPLAEYGMPSSDDLVNKTSVYFKDYDAILMENHGVIIGSKTTEDAYQKLEIAEEYAKTVIYARILGGERVLPEKDVKDVLSLKG